MENRAWCLFTKRLSGEISLDEQSELNEMMIQNPGLHRELELFDSWWSNCGFQREMPDNEEAFEKLVLKLGDSWKTTSCGAETVDPFLQNDHSKYRWLWFSGAAAAVMALVWFLAFGPAQQPAVTTTGRTVETVTTDAGSTRKISLPDGTEVWLNAVSTLKYAHFSATKREVTLDGEAYFDVKHNTNLPFLIHTSKGTVKVLGTILNVRAYANECRFEASLIRGKVEVVMKDNPEKIFILKPEQKIVLESYPSFTMDDDNLKTPGYTRKADLAEVPVARITPLARLAANDPAVETAWLYNTLAFQDETFREVADKMEKWYGVEIRFHSTKLENERLTGTFRQESLLQALNALQYITDFNYTQKNNIISIAPN